MKKTKSNFLLFISRIPRCFSKKPMILEMYCVFSLKIVTGDRHVQIGSNVLKEATKCLAKFFIIRNNFSSFSNVFFTVLLKEDQLLPSRLYYPGFYLKYNLLVFLKGFLQILHWVLRLTFPVRLNFVSSKFVPKSRSLHDRVVEFFSHERGFLYPEGIFFWYLHVFKKWAK